jgi:catechol 2,3-dioxygenase-like lactoylglutathione lyase family enzyme
MQIINELKMLAIVVSDMPKAKEFYSEKLGLKVMSDYRQSDDRWWVALTLPEGGVTITLTTYHENAKLGAMTLWFATPDIVAAHEELSGKGVEVSKIGDDLHGPGSGTKWFNFKDPDGNLIHIEQA